MTVSTVVDHNDYTGNGVTTSFPYTFRIFKKDDLAVTVLDLSGNLTVLVLDTDYTVTNAGGYSGGNVVLTAPLANGWQISIARELEPTQETDLRNQGKFFAEVHEDAFDKLTMLIQQVSSLFRLALRKPSSIANWYDALNNYIRNLKDPQDPQDAATKNYVDEKANSDFNRTLRVPESFIPQLPSAAMRANRIQGFDSLGDPVMLIPESGSASDVLLQLASIEAGKGDSLIGVKQHYPSTIGTTQDEFNGRFFNFADWGVKGDGVTDDSAAIQAALNEIPAGSTISFNSGNYLFSNITLSKSVRITGSGYQQGGTVWINNSPTNPFFKATNKGNFKIDSFYAKPSVTPTGGSWFQFTKCFRISMDNFFLEDYFLGMEFDGDGSINIDKFSMYTSIVGLSGTGGMRFGKNNYTGSVNIDNGYMKKLSDSIVGSPEFGIRLGYVDVVNIGPGMTIIQHGKDLFIDPHDAQFASLVRSAGAMYDTADYGIFIQPYNNGRVQACEFTGIYAGANNVAAMAIDGTLGMVNGLTISGGDFLTNPIGIDITGDGCNRIIVNGAKISANSDAGIHLSNQANAYIKNCLIGDGSLSGNNNGISLDVTVSGFVTGNTFTNNVNSITGTSVSMQVFDNFGIDNWKSFSPTVSSQSGTITTASGTLRYRKANNTVFVNAEITITNNGTGSNSVLVTLPFTVRTHATGTGRGQIISGKGLQVFAAAGGQNMAIRNSSDGSYPGANGELLVVSLVYETIA